MGEGSEAARRSLLVAAVLGCFLIQVSPALATVHVDPNGPAGQQYAVPLNSARGEAAGDESAGAPGSSAKPPLFGEGVKPSRSSSGSGSVAAGKGDSNGSPHATDVAVAIKPSGSDSSKVPLVVGLIAAVALVGAGAGLLARRLSTESQA